MDSVLSVPFAIDMDASEADRIARALGRALKPE